MCCAIAASPYPVAVGVCQPPCLLCCDRDDIDRYVTSAQAQRRLLEETIAEEGLDAALQATSVLAYPLHRRVPRQVGLDGLFESVGPSC